MKTTKNTIAAIRRKVLTTAPLLLLLVFGSCNVTYNSKTADVEGDLFTGDFNQASASIDQNSFLQKKRNRLLYLMEKGKIEHLRGNYEESNRLFEEAYIMLDDRIRTNAGQAVAAKFTNPMAEPYKGEDFEKVTIYYYKALNYFELGQPDEALVEAKRINIKLNELNENYKENKNKYSEDAFSQILQGIIYESIGDINNAFISYRNAEEIYGRNGGDFFGVPMPEQLKYDLVRTAKKMGFTQEYNEYREKYNIDPDPEPSPKSKKGKKAKAAPEPAPVATAKDPEGEAIVFWENGMGPVKDQIMITAAGGGGIFYGSYQDEDGLQEIMIPIPPGTDIGNISTIAIPKYRRRISYYSNASVMVDGQEEPFELAQDFYPIARQCLKDRMLRETIDLVLRFATKKVASKGLGMLADNLLGDGAGDLVQLGADAAGAATEKADTRNWQSLPATISYVRIPLKEGDNKFLIKKYGPEGIDTDTLTIPFKRGLQIVNYFDLGRTQVLPPEQIQPQQSLATAKTTVEKTQAATMVPTSAIADTAPKATVALPSVNYKPVGKGVTLETVINKYVAASGGKENLNAIQTKYEHTRTHANYNGTETITESVTKTNANHDVRSDTYVNGSFSSTIIVNDSGTYMIDAKGKRTTVSTKPTKVQGSYYDMYVSLLHNDTAKLDGITTLNGHEVYAVSYKLPNNNSSFINYFNTSDFLLYGVSTYTVINNKPNTTTITFADYRDVSGTMFPFKMQVQASNLQGTSETSYLELKINEGVSDADFQ